MGRSLHHQITFGIDIGWDDEREFEAPEVIDGFDLDDYICRKACIEDRDWTARREAVKAFPLDVSRYGVGDYQGKIICVRRLTQGGYDGPTEVAIAGDMAPTDLEIAALRSFFEEFGFPWTEPKWTTSAVYW